MNLFGLDDQIKPHILLPSENTPRKGHVRLLGQEHWASEKGNE
jgi:hypothetical protein